MASIPVQQLRPKAQSLRALRSIVTKHPTRLSAICTACLSTSQISTFNQSITSSSSHKQTNSIGVEWYEYSAARKIQHLLNSLDSKWGWVIYRCTYKPELQGAWESFKNLKLDWVWVEGPELEGAPLNELKRKFREWVRTDIQDLNFVYDAYTAPCSLGSRYSYFIHVDEESLLSCLCEAGVDLHGGHVNIVRGWADSLAPEEATDEFGGELYAEDWMKIQASMINPSFYVELHNDESWYVYYRSPPSVLPYH
ncbi:hypothetical protein ACQKWADRAFT_329436 [Trichoderma austrokoningii]